MFNSTNWRYLCYDNEMSNIDEDLFKASHQILIEQAIIDCKKWHAGQSYGNELHCEHCAQVVDILRLKLKTLTPPVEVAAWHHDLFEDTNISQQHYKANYGTYIHALVWACTGEGSNRKERQASIKAKLKEMPEAIPIKIADRCANMLKSLGDEKYKAMYLKEEQDFREIVDLIRNIEPALAIYYDDIVAMMRSPHTAFDVQNPKQLKSDLSLEYDSSGFHCG